MPKEETIFSRILLLNPFLGNKCFCQRVWNTMEQESTRSVSPYMIVTCFADWYFIFATNSDFPFPISLQPIDVDFRYLSLNTKGLRTP